MIPIRDERWQSYCVVIPLTAATFALATLALRLGVAGLVAGGIIGALWALALGRVTRLIGVRWPNALSGWSIALAIVATGLLLGGGLMYGLVASAVSREPSTTAAALSALMKPTVPYFISVNTALEALIVPALVYSNWTVPRRRRLTIAGATLYFVMRAWTYLTYAPMRMDLASRPLSAEDIAWYQRTMSVDYRGVLVAAVLVCVVLAALRGSHVPHEERRFR